MNIQKSLFFFLMLILAFSAVADEQDTSKWKTYHDKKYGFEIKFPPSAILENDNFVGEEDYLFNVDDAFVSQSWRSTAIPFYDTGPNSAGTQILSFMTFNRYISPDDHSFPTAANPTFYTTGLNIGVSDDPIDVANCVKGSASTVKINSITFHTFNFGDGGCLKFSDGVSYRTLHNNKCYALEQIEFGSNLADSGIYIPQAVLKKYYDRAYPILQTFKFIPAK